MKTSLIQLRIGNPIIYEPNGRNYELTIVNYKLTPNGINDPKLVCLITASGLNGFTVEATSDKFIVKDSEEYETVYKPFDSK